MAPHSGHSFKFPVANLRESVLGLFGKGWRSIGARLIFGSEFV